MESLMALSYIDQPRLAIPRRRKLVGTRHEGPEWTRAVRDLRKAIKAVANRASWRPDTTADSVGIPILESLDDLNPGSLHVLELVNAILVRNSQR
jgi:hypothetical protein